MKYITKIISRSRPFFITILKEGVAMFKDVFNFSNPPQFRGDFRCEVDND